MSSTEPISLSEMQEQLRRRLDYLEQQMEPLVTEAEQIRKLLGDGSARDPGQADDTHAALLRAVAESPGRSGADYAATVGVTGATALRHLKVLADDGRIRREGQ